MDYIPPTFSYDDLVSANALDDAPTQLPNLTNPIHRIYNLRHVDLSGFPSGTYAALSPSFRLASHFLTHPRFSKYLIVAANQPLPSRKTAPDDPWTMNHEPLNIRSYTRLQTKLHELADNYSIHFDSKTLDIEVPWAGAATFPLPKMKDYLDPFTKPRYPEHYPVLTFHRAFWAELATSDAFAQCSPARKIRFYFYLAVQLAHEVAHLVHLADRTRAFADRTDDVRTVDFVEGRYDASDPFVEAGFSWEKTIFGGHTHHLESSGFHERGVAVQRFGGAEGNYFQILPVEYMAQFFQDDFWKDDALPLPGTEASTTSSERKFKVLGFELDAPLPSSSPHQRPAGIGPRFTITHLWRPSPSYFEGLPKARKDQIAPDERKAYDGRVGYEINGKKKSYSDAEAQKRRELEKAREVERSELWELEQLLGLGKEDEDEDEEEGPRKRFKLWEEE